MSTIGGFDTGSLVQIGVTLVIVGGLTYWMHNRINKMQETMDLMQEKINKHDEIIQSFEQILVQHSNALRQIYGQPPINPGNIPQKANPPKAQQKKQMPPQKQNTTKPGIFKEKKPIKEEEDDTENPDFDKETNVDDLLKGELEELECDVETGECKIPEQKKKLKM
jgi:hypothetical protein